MARACTHVMNLEKSIYEKHLDPMCSHINVGTREDLTIKKLAETDKDVVGYKGEIELDPDKPDGSPRKLMDSGRLTNFGWKPEVHLKEGLIRSYKSFLKYKDKS
jgi:GDP-L-fucose synthase